jgi:hypothetical protein
MTANHNSRSLGDKTPNKNLSASDVSVPSQTPSGPCLNRRFAVGLNVCAYPSHFFHPWNPRLVSSPCCSLPELPNFREFTFRNPIGFTRLHRFALKRKMLLRTAALSILYPLVRGWLSHNTHTIIFEGEIDPSTSLQITKDNFRRISPHKKFQIHTIAPYAKDQSCPAPRWPL